MRTREARFDGRKGINRAFSAEVLDRYELFGAGNARMGPFGSWAKMAGSQRVHDSVIGGGAKVLGLHQWVPAAGRQLVAISNSELYHKIQADAEFTEVAGSFSTTVRPVFAAHLIAGTPTLFIADGTLRSFNGVSTITAISGAPAALYIVVYKGRMFAFDGSKVVYYSDIEDPTTWTEQANVETYDTLGVKAAAVVGSSLLMFKANSVARFVGNSNADIQIDQQTEGVSPDIGTIAPNTVLLMEEVAFFLTDRGPYVASEAGVQAVGVKIENEFDDAEMDHLPNAIAVHHKARREVWIFFPENTETTNTVGYCLNYRQQTWTGPWDMGGTFDVCSAAPYELTDQKESVVLGGYDGRVRRGDVVAVGAKHDVLRDGTGGTATQMDLVLPTLFFGDPTATKRFLAFQEIAADLGATGSLQVIFTDDLTGATHTETIATKGAGIKQYKFRIPGMFQRGTLTLRDATSEITQINGIMLTAGLFWR